MRAVGTGSTGITVALRTWFLFTLVVWVVAVLLLATSPVGLVDGVPLGFAAYWILAVFTMAALVNAIVRTAGAERIFWAGVGAGLLFRFAGNTTVAGFQVFDLVPPLFAPNDVTYGISYALLFGAIIWLVVKAARNIAFVAALDTLGVMFFTGLISWHFALAPAASGASWEGLKSLLLARSGPVFDVGLLCLALVVACSDLDLARRAFPLAGAFGAFLVADGLYLGLGTAHQANSWPELFWALGIALIGLAALNADGNTRAATQLVVSPRVVAIFWFSPLSPAVQLAFLLALGAMRPPLPSYILWGGAVITLYLALRISLGTYASRHIQHETGRRATVSERDRISEDLHDTLKQCVHSVPMMLGAYRKGPARKTRTRRKTILDHAQCRPASGGQLPGIRPDTRATGRWRNDRCGYPGSFGPTHPRHRQELRYKATEQDLQASFEGLSSERLSAAYRITSEALWNAARHSGAKKIKVETRKIGSVFLLRVRDDGHGFDADQRGTGMGLALMRRRAEEAGGELDVISKPGHGTTVQIRFEDK